MYTLIEAIILYLVLFLPGILSNRTYPELIIFSANRELIRLVVYTIPALALIWYLLYKRPVEGKNRIPSPGLTDLTTVMLCLPGLILLGFGISVLSNTFTLPIDLPLSPQVEAPGNLPAWAVMAISCLGIGYMEESFFRFYLLQRFAEAGIGIRKSILFSTLLFSCCHIYEGPWGVLNAALAGLGLSLVFVKQGSFHGIAWSHGGYNAFVYVIGSMQ